MRADMCLAVLAVLLVLAQAKSVEEPAKQGFKRALQQMPLTIQNLKKSTKREESPAARDIAASVSKQARALATTFRKRALEKKALSEQVRSLDEHASLVLKARNIQKELSKRADEEVQKKRAAAMQTAHEQVREAMKTMARRGTVSGKDKVMRSLHEAKIKRTLDKAKRNLEDLKLERKRAMEKEE